ncbi:hypothetical protein Agub_g14723 [Astrephomene gubernaculifera]|uniref:DNA-directed DNA polymerase family A palm domain-containing protein n=1 Tax=Astrephomene gubernaculifera TaxID=47775 RepID=A0AAD3E5Z3_9CHLO|nr:hypothetical protein Agub_g14723 [Astrephomene gubernaculifera]
MSLAGSALLSGGLRSASQLSTPLASGDAGTPPMRRGLSRLGSGLTDNGSQLFMLQRWVGSGMMTGPLWGLGRHRLSDAAALRAYGSSTRPQPGGREQAPVPHVPLDKEHVNAQRMQREAARLSKQYDNPDPRELMRLSYQATKASGGQQPHTAPMLLQERSGPARLPPPPQQQQHQTVQQQQQSPPLQQHNQLQQQQQQQPHVGWQSTVASPQPAVEVVEAEEAAWETAAATAPAAAAAAVFQQAPSLHADLGPAAPPQHPAAQLQQQHHQQPWRHPQHPQLHQQHQPQLQHQQQQYLQEQQPQYPPEMQQQLQPQPQQYLQEQQQSHYPQELQQQQYLQEQQQSHYPQEMQQQLQPHGVLQDQWAPQHYYGGQGQPQYYGDTQPEQQQQYYSQQHLPSELGSSPWALESPEHPQQQQQHPQPQLFHPALHPEQHNYPQEGQPQQQYLQDQQQQHQQHPQQQHELYALAATWPQHSHAAADGQTTAAWIHPQQQQLQQQQLQGDHLLTAQQHHPSYYHQQQPQLLYQHQQIRGLHSQQQPPTATTNTSHLEAQDSGLDDLSWAEPPSPLPLPPLPPPPQLQVPEEGGLHHHHQQQQSWQAHMQQQQSEAAPAAAPAATATALSEAILDTLRRSSSPGGPRSSGAGEPPEHQGGSMWAGAEQGAPAGGSSDAGGEGGGAGQGEAGALLPMLGGRRRNARSLVNEVEAVRSRVQQQVAAAAAVEATAAGAGGGEAILAAPPLLPRRLRQPYQDGTGEVGAQPAPVASATWVSPAEGAAQEGLGGGMYGSGISGSGEGVYGADGGVAVQQPLAEAERWAAGPPLTSALTPPPPLPPPPAGSWGPEAEAATARPPPPVTEAPLAAGAAVAEAVPEGVAVLSDPSSTSGTTASVLPEAAEAAAAEAPKKKTTKKRILGKTKKSAAAAAPDESGSAGAEGESAAAAAVASPAKRTRKKSAAAAASPSAEAGDAAAATAAAAVTAAPIGRPPAAAAAAVAPYLAEGLLAPAEPLTIDGGYYQVVEGYATRQPLMTQAAPDILVVDTPEVARAVVDRLLSVAASPYPAALDRSNPAVQYRYFGCDTEVAFIDVTSETPVGHGAVLCFSIYAGDDLDFADCALAAASAASAAPGVTHGSSPAVRKDRIWVDIWGEVELGEDGRPIWDGRYVRLKSHHPILEEFRRFFENDEVKKVWHNYGFDRHVMENMGVCCRGFGGDTLHMARLADASRSGRRTYGLDNLTADKDIMKYFTPYKRDAPPRQRMGDRRHLARSSSSSSGPPTLLNPFANTNTTSSSPAFGGPFHPTASPTSSFSSPTDSSSSSSPGAQRSAALAELVRAKMSMKERFGMYRLRGGGAVGKVPELPPIHELHGRPLFRPTWIDYSALDAKATWQLREALEGRLRRERWEMERALAVRLGYGGEAAHEYLNLWHFYCAYWIDFGELLTEMERRGMMVDRSHLAAAQQAAERDRQAAVREFLDWADSKVPGARFMNAGSGAQIRMLLFPDFPGYTTKAAASEAAKAKAAKNRAAAAGAGGGAAAAAGAAEADGGEAAAAGGSRVIRVENPKYKEMLERGEKPSCGKYMDVELHGIWGRGVPGRLQPEIITATGAAAVSIKVLRGLAGKPGAARKELTRLYEARAAQQQADEEAARAAAEAAAAAARTAVPLVGDLLEESLSEMRGGDGEGNGVGGGGEGEAEAEMPLEPEVLDPTTDGSSASSPASSSSAVQAPPGSPSSSPPGLPPQPAADPAQLEALEKEAKDKGLGRLFVACGGGEEGLRACVAIEALCEVNAIDKLLSAFIIPLQGDNTSTTTLLPLPPPTTTTADPAAAPSDAPTEAAAGGDPTSSSPTSPTPTSTSPYRAVHRVHCSLNINTETGRLSARRPNLQNQPALEKDRYRVRKAFTADTAADHTLVVADYGQLELRILAHMTDCKSMQEAFILGGDFHSRTAYGMYDYIQKDVQDGGCYLEWEGSGEPDKPLVKDKYASERRKAKVLNFSIAYGKTAHGLAADFKTTKEEAQATVDRWYADRPEVRRWQKHTQELAKQEGKVRTLLGRTRPLPNIDSHDFKLLGHSMRAAINTPIQGSAADVAAAAMVAIHKSEELRATGFKLLMQIHDEVILEGPKATSDTARRLVMQLMANPWAELAKHWNAPGGADPSSSAGRGMQQGPDWHRMPPKRPGGHLAGVWRQAPDEKGAGGGGEGGGEGGHGFAMPLLVELATDCNVADTWYEAK